MNFKWNGDVGRPFGVARYASVIADVLGPDTSYCEAGRAARRHRYGDARTRSDFSAVLAPRYRRGHLGYARCDGLVVECEIGRESADSHNRASWKLILIVLFFN